MGSAEESGDGFIDLELEFCYASRRDHLKQDNITTKSLCEAALLNVKEKYICL